MRSKGSLRRPRTPYLRVSLIPSHLEVSQSTGLEGARDVVQVKVDVQTMPWLMGGTAA